ncbi:MAG TPA: DCC1-like thiol-disulfide oxidoreductase family protein, partial [Candidatus Acidoferrum sp.]|nr:DCC1-like thiol-disulfide oxidoreductase family protein [Candidatus Acidoferrum sp.]
MTSRPYLIYDGICNLCIGSVKILNALDKSGLIRFVPYQELSTSARERYGLTRDMLQGRIHL